LTGEAAHLEAAKEPTGAIVASDPHHRLRVRQEGSDARVTTERLDFLFPDSQAHNIGETYSRLILKADSHFAPRWKAHTGANIAPDAFHEVLQEITLHWMYFCAINHLPLDIADEDWEHPQTRRIIRSGVKQTLQAGSGAETQLCAHLMGLSKAEYLHWREADDAFLSIL
jgi:hypothetical protein